MKSDRENSIQESIGRMEKRFDDFVNATDILKIYMRSPQEQKEMVVKLSQGIDVLGKTVGGLKYATLKFCTN